MYLLCKRFLLYYTSATNGIVNLMGAESNPRARLTRVLLRSRSSPGSSARLLRASRYSEFPSHPLSSRQVTRVFGVPLGVPRPDFRPYPTDTKKPEVRLFTGLPANEPGGSRTHDLRIKSQMVDVAR